jgi:CYTH domain-containing protein
MDGGRASSFHIIQGYFGYIDRLRVRVRIRSDEHKGCTAFLTFKGARRGLCRLEFEYPLALERARCALDTLPSAQIIRKMRYEVPYRDGPVWTVDQFEGPNSGLVLAEIELAHPNQRIELPSWIGEEVTFNSRYGNSRLARVPMPRHLVNAA